jgi:hypothetical protein
VRGASCRVICSCRSHAAFLSPRSMRVPPSSGSSITSTESPVPSVAAVYGGQNGRSSPLGEPCFAKSTQYDVTKLASCISSAVNPAVGSEKTKLRTSAAAVSKGAPMHGKAEQS